jgi:hypothetical protein
MGMKGLPDKATDLVAEKTPHVLGALGQIKFFIIGIPIISILIGIATQKVLPERHEVLAKFELGSFVLPGDYSNPVDLAEEKPMYTRIRNSAKIIREKYDGALLLSARLEEESPVVTVTVTANGLDESTAFLHEVLNTELTFQNERLARFTEVFEDRKQLLNSLIAESSKARDELTQAIVELSGTDLGQGEWFALHSSRNRLNERVDLSKEELNDMKFLQALDFYIGKSEVTVVPTLVAKSSWYRPLIFGVFGLAVGLFLVLILCVFTVFRTPRGEDKKETTENVNEDTT